MKTLRVDKQKSKVNLIPKLFHTLSTLKLYFIIKCMTVFEGTQYA